MVNIPGAAPPHVLLRQLAAHFRTAYFLLGCNTWKPRWAYNEYGSPHERGSPKSPAPEKEKKRDRDEDGTPQAKRGKQTAA